jgi:molybdate transport system substrate-binding protein
MKRIILGLLLISAIISTGPALRGEETVRLSGPASLADALKEVIALFNATGDHTPILTNIGSSGAMAKQIHEGAPADIFISANTKWMNYLHDENKIDPASEKILAGNVLVFVGKKNPAIAAITDIVQLKQIAIGSPKSVPAGEYASQALEKAGIYQKLEEGKQLIVAKDVRQALVYADRGETDGAFVYRTDALLATQAVILFEVPQDLYDRVTYPIALTAEGAEKPEARAFYAFLTGPEAMQVLAKYGFTAGK